MSVDSHYMFTVPLFKTKVTPWKHIKQQVIDIVGNTYLEDERGFLSDYYNNNYNEKLYEVLKPFVHEITSNCLNLPAPNDPPNMWSQKYYAGTEHPIHNHGNRGYSFILYVNFDPSLHKATNFISPFDNFFSGDMLCFEPHLEEGDLIAFPSVIKHSSQYQTSDEERMIVSFNTFEDGI